MGGVPPAPGGAQLCGGVRGAVVDQHPLRVRVGLSLEGSKGCGKPSCGVVDWHNHGYFRRPHLPSASFTSFFTVLLTSHFLEENDVD